MSETPNILKKMDSEAIKWQECAICGQQKQRIVQQEMRPDFALCDGCQSAFVLEDGGQMRMMYGQIPASMPQTRQFALKQWKKYFDIRAIALQERQALKVEDVVQTPTEASSIYDDHESAILDFEAQKADLFYSRAKKIEAPPRRLRETGELPDLDSLFRDPD